MVLSVASVSRAQSPPTPISNEFRSWNAYVGDHRFGDGKLSLVFDTQMRVTEVADGIGQFLVRPGLLFDVKPWARVGGGYAFVLSYPGVKGMEVPEHRIWQQGILKQQVGRVPLIHRLRVEQRWLGVKTLDPSARPVISDYEYRNRFRYFNRATVPLTKKHYLALQNEIFVNFGKRPANKFDQTRTSATLGFQLGRIGSIEGGYMLLASNSATGRVTFHHILLIALNGAFSF